MYDNVSKIVSICTFSLDNIFLSLVVAWKLTSILGQRLYSEKYA